MDNYLVATIGLILLAYIMLVLGFVTRIKQTQLKSTIIQISIAICITVFLFIKNFDSCLRRGRLFTDGLGIEGKIPVGFATAGIAVVWFLFILFFIRIGSHFWKRISGLK